MLGFEAAIGLTLMEARRCTAAKRAWLGGRGRGKDRGKDGGKDRVRVVVGVRVVVRVRAKRASKAAALASAVRCRSSRCALLRSAAW